MPTPSFAVYVDAPVVDSTRKSKPAQSETSSKPGLSLQSANLAKSLAPVVAVANKENYNPLTGMASSSSGIEKKRKTSGLAVKASPLESSADAAVSQPVTKKRKSSVSSTSSSSSKTTKSAKKGKKVVKKTRQASPLPKVEEESVEAAKEVEEQPDLIGALMDARCYELTVSPLADVSAAYGPASTMAKREPSPFLRDSSAEPQLRDRFSPTPQPPSSSKSPADREPSQEPRVFTTPERKAIYAAFTFSSPSPPRKSRSPSSPRDDTDDFVL